MLRNERDSSSDFSYASLSLSPVSLVCRGNLARYETAKFRVFRRSTRRNIRIKLEIRRVRDIRDDVGSRYRGTFEAW